MSEAATGPRSLSVETRNRSAVAAGDDERVGVLGRRRREGDDRFIGERGDELVVGRRDVVAGLGRTEAVELGGGAGVLRDDFDQTGWRAPARRTRGVRDRTLARTSNPAVSRAWL